MTSQVDVGLNAVIVAVTEEVPRILTVGRSDLGAFGDGDGDGDGDGAGTTPEPAVEALPFGPLDPTGDRTLELGLRRWVREQTGIELGYAEQLYTFGDRHRDPRERVGGPRVISVAYLTLVREERPSGASDARWRDVYALFPWEDWRAGRPKLIERDIVPALEAWIDAAPAGSREHRERSERAEIAFGLSGVAWDGERVLDRYELLYEVGLVAEAARDRRGSPELSGTLSGGSSEVSGTSGTVDEQRRIESAPEVSGTPPAGSTEVSGTSLGRPMALDHRRMVASALGRLRGKLRYRPVVFELLPPTFILSQLQRTVEALAGVRLHKGNFRRLVEKGGLVEGTGRFDSQTGGRPAEIFAFRRDVLRERPAPGVGLPGVRS